MYTALAKLLYNYIENGGVHIQSHEACDAWLVYDIPVEKLAEEILALLKTKTVVDLSQQWCELCEVHGHFPADIDCASCH